MNIHPNYSYPTTEENFLQAPEQNQAEKLKLFSLFHQIWQYFVTVLAQGKQPKIWQSCDRFGQIWWYGYDPVTGCSICRDSEDEIRVWLEERYYR